MSSLLTRAGKYHLFTFEKESYFEDQVIEHASEIFGEKTIYFDIKKRLDSKHLGLSSIPDGFLLDLSVADDVAFYVVEVELSSHDVREIAKQVLTFDITFNDSIPKIHDLLIKQLQDNHEYRILVDSALGNSSVYRNIDHLLNEVLNTQEHQYLIVIDRVTDALTSALSKLKLNIRLHPINTFANESNEYVFLFPDFRDQTAEPAEPSGSKDSVETWYQFYMTDVEEMSMSKEDFLKERKIAPFQGFTYTRDQAGNIDGIVFQGYRNRIEKDQMILKTNPEQFWWGTRRPIKLENLFVGMQVFVLETDYDMDTGRRTENPQVRVHGKLREVLKARADAKERLFPK